MKEKVEVRHYTWLGKPVRPDDVRGLYVLKIVWHCKGNHLLRSEKSGWLKAAPDQRVDFKTWKQLWDWVAQIRKTTAASRTSRRGP